jgi:hypothetical protein
MSESELYKFACREWHRVFFIDIIGFGEKSDICRHASQASQLQQLLIPLIAMTCWLADLLTCWLLHFIVSKDVGHWKRNELTNSDKCLANSNNSWRHACHLHAHSSFRAWSTRNSPPATRPFPWVRHPACRQAPCPATTPLTPNMTDVSAQGTIELLLYLLLSTCWSTSFETL